jgi:hypothetical protein
MAGALIPTSARRRATLNQERRIKNADAVFSGIQPNSTEFNGNSAGFR